MNQGAAANISKQGEKINEGFIAYLVYLPRNNISNLNNTYAYV